MDSYYGNINSKVPKRNSLSPIHNFGSQNPYYHHAGHVMDPYAPDGHITVLKNMNSPFLRNLQSGRSLLASPSLSGEHSPSPEYTYRYNMGYQGSENFGKKEPPIQSRSPVPFYNSPVKLEEDVVVMDGVLVKNKPVSKSRSSSSSLTDSGGSSSSSGGKNYKMDPRAAYLENSDISHYGSKYQFSHGNKELHQSPPLPISYKNMLETPCKQYSITGTCSFGSKCRFLHPTQTSPTEATSSIKQDESTSSRLNLKSANWSPMDDDIMIYNATGRTPSSDDFDAYMNNVVYGPRRTKRLPVFKQICPE